MYIAMNRFAILKGSEVEFETRWKNRQSRLKDLPGFIDFQLLRCDTQDDGKSTLFASHAVWNTKEDFINWTKSEQFRDAHKNAGQRKEIFAAAPKFEGFEVVVSE